MSFVLLVTFLCSFALISSKAQDASSPTTNSNVPQPTICGDIIAAVDQDYQFIFDADDVYNCLTSVPFNAAVALNFIQYYNTTLQFQSTLAYLREPPVGYQQPAVDVLHQLELIQHNVTAGYYKNEYAFEADLQLLVHSMHDSHVALTAGVLAAFSFASPIPITSASIDGKKPPQVFFQNDIVASQREGWQPSPIDSINGEPAIEYLTRFAALNSAGNLEPHADWNQLMEAPAIDIQGSFSVFRGGATFYPGRNLNFTFANGTQNPPAFWLAIYNNYPNDTGPLTTGGDFYNYFVLGLLPASYNDNLDSNESAEDGDASTSSASPTSFHDASSGAYPNHPDIEQSDLSIEGDGVLTGYFLRDISVAVLSVPTFQQSGYSIANFSQTVTGFIDQATEANLSKVIIDLQQNTGGNVELVFDMFHRFFPTVDPFAGSRRRSHEIANILGSATTGYFEQTQQEMDSANEWIVTNRLNAETNRNFTSWEEYFGPRTFQADNFSLPERYNTSSKTFAAWAFDGWIPYAYTTTPTTRQPWNARDIVLLTDGLCASSCSLFLEMMVHDAGARTIVVGGRPDPGPMQAASGTRGALLYTADDLDTDFQNAGSLNETADSALPPLDTSFYVTYAGINLRDQVQPNDPTPLQFKYEAADCRIYYTLANVYNMSRLWRDAAQATWDDSSLCVEGSTGYSTSRSGTDTMKAPPALTAQLPSLELTGANRVIDFNMDGSGGLQAGRSKSGNYTEIVECRNGTCSGRAICRTVKYNCGNGSPQEKELCLPRCTNSSGDEGCAGAGTSCNSTNRREEKKSTRPGASSTDPRNTHGGAHYNGQCTPKIPKTSMGDLPPEVRRQVLEYVLQPTFQFEEAKLLCAQSGTKHPIQDVGHAWLYCAKRGIRWTKERDIKNYLRVNKRFYRDTKDVLVRHFTYFISWEYFSYRPNSMTSYPLRLHQMRHLALDLHGMWSSPLPKNSNDDLLKKFLASAPRLGSLVLHFLPWAQELGPGDAFFGESVERRLTKKGQRILRRSYLTEEYYLRLLTSMRYLRTCVIIHASELHKTGPRLNIYNQSLIEAYGVEMHDRLKIGMEEVGWTVEENRHYRLGPLRTSIPYDAFSAVSVNRLVCSRSLPARNSGAVAESFESREDYLLGSAMRSFDELTA
ncbi:MAG: hypothetical protein M1820_003934 [Bogoriella megaspora]|nr:MAG: hypothetical protein M1820_003934 [Bogoriella megaspora]